MVIGFCTPAKSLVLSGESPQEIKVIPADVTMLPVAPYHYNPTLAAAQRSSVPWDQNVYFDRNLRPRAVHYYKLRAEKGNKAPDFSGTEMFRTNSKNAPSVPTAMDVDENIIGLTLEDRSHNDIRYTLRGISPDDTGTRYAYAADIQTMDKGLPVFKKVTADNVITAGSTICTGTGTIRWEVWQNETGTDISSVDYYKSPDLTTALTIFESPRYHGNNYGSRVRGYICPPVTGSYTFWIASDDRGELWLSTDDDPIKKVKIASVPGYTPYRNWNKYASQRSAPVTLQAGRRYYIEALHKEISGDDYVSVGWQLPDGTLERPIAGNRLIPFGNPANTAPAIILHEPVEGQVYTEPANVFMFATASPQDTSHPVTKVVFYKDTTKVYEDTTEPFQYSLNNVTEGTYTITAQVVDAAGESNMAHARITVNAPSCSEGTGGLIVREIWRNIPGTSVSSIPVDSDYDDLQGISGFATQTYYANDYGSRIRAQVCVPQTGNYVFWIASDDNSELWLSTTAEPGNKVKIASVTGATKVQQWTKYSSQQSAPIALTAGYRYYIEALHKEANGNDHVEVGWQLADGTLERPIPANRLIAYSESGDLAAAAMASAAIPVSDNTQDALGLYPNPAINHEVALTVSGDVMQRLNDAQVQVISTTGEVVHTQTVKCDGDCNDVLLSLKENIRPGVYMVTVLMGRKRLSKKLLVE